MANGDAVPDLSMTTSPSGRYRFGAFELQPDERRLLLAGDAVRIGRHGFDLLVVMVERSGRLIGKDELLERVWPGLVVEENTLQAHVSALRKILGRGAIATVSGRGYRFALEVDRVDAPSPAVPRHNLPHALTSFIGREKQVAELRHLLGLTRLLTLTGAGGCGKTRLALQVVLQQAPKFPDGAWFVELAALANPALVTQSVAMVLGVKEQAGRSLLQSLVAFLGTRHLLLVLDNAEHVLGACAALADALVRQCERLVILLTSRERLGIAGESTYRVPSLAIPDTASIAEPQHLERCESVRLFVDRARMQRPHFQLTAENAAAVVAICRRLDGIPLAIELAAARVRAMSAEEVSRRLDQRFSLLTGGSQTALPRQRRLRALIDWSYDLLTDREKVFLDRTSVFAGGCTLDAAEAVCAGDAVDRTDVLDLLASLVDKSLLVADERDGASRYGLLETVRQYARDQLRDSGDEAPTQRRHGQIFLALSEEFRDAIARGEDAQGWLARIDAEHDNLRAALAWSTSAADSRAGLALAGNLAWFWAVRGHLAEGRGWLSTVLSTAPGEQDPAARARALVGAGVLVAQEGDDGAAQALYEAALAIYRTLADRRGIAYAIASLGNVAMAQGDFPTARRLVEEGLDIVRELGNRVTLGELLGVLGEVAGELGDYAAARLHLEECLAIAREFDEPMAIAWAQSRFAKLAAAQRQYPAAAGHFKEALTIVGALGDQWGSACFLEGFAAVAAVLAGPERAACIWGGAVRLREDIGAPMATADLARYARDVAAARAAIGDETAFERAWQQGRAMTPEQTMRYALDTQVVSGGA